jgi:hypothetical protein
VPVVCGCSSGASFFDSDLALEAGTIRTGLAGARAMRTSRGWPARNRVMSIGCSMSLIYQPRPAFVNYGLG